MADDVISVLVVDGDPAQGSVVAGLLGRGTPEYAVTRAATVAEARDELAAAGHDCVVVDLAPAGAAGASPVDLVRSLADEAPVVVLAAGADELRSGMLALGADDCLGSEHLEPEALDRSIRDAIERNRALDETARTAMHDALTGLPTRRLLEDRLVQALERAGRTGTTVAVAFLDVDHLGAVNHAEGHAVGDAILRQAAVRLRATIRGSDTLARHAGDEFVAVWEGVDGERAAVALARRMLEAFEAPLATDHGAFAITASLGVALAEPGDDPSAILRDANTAMYRAKRRGGGHFELFDETMRARALAAVRDEQALRDALSQGTLEVRYEPIVDAETGTPWGAGAVVSWLHPQRGRLGMAEVLEIAGRARLGSALTDWLLRQTCRQLATWLADAPDALWTRISLKLPPEQVGNSALPDTVAAALTRSGVAGDRLRLEVDEHALAPADAAATLTRLCALGVSVQLDDFGTGASSLGLLRRLPVQHLRVGGSLIAGIAEDPTAERIVEAVSSMAESLGLAVTATGVATPEVLRAAVELRITWLQGAAISEPLPAEAFAGWVADARGAEALSRAGVRQGQATAGEVTLVEAAEVLGVSVSTVRRWADSGRLAANRTPGGHRRVQRADLRRMARASRGPAALRSARLPSQPLPLAAQALAASPGELAGAVAGALYDQPGDSWLTDPAGIALVAGWQEQLAAALASGRYGPVVTETQRLVRHARLAGATMLECFLFLETVGAAVGRAMRRHGPAANPEVAELQQLCRALAQAIETDA